MKKSLVWLRRDLRIYDHHALNYACENSEEVHLVFIFDSNILDSLPKNDRRLGFIIDSLNEIQKKVSIHILYGEPEIEIPKLALNLKIDFIATNRDYEPYAKKRDAQVKKAFPHFLTFKDHVIFEKEEVLTQSGNTFKVFTPYKNQWLKKFHETYDELPTYSVNLKKIAKFKNEEIKTKFIPLSSPLTAGTQSALKLLKKFDPENYKKTRDFPSINGTSSLSVYLRFGCVSIRDLVKVALESSEKTWLSEFIWREFYQVILDAHPEVTTRAFKPEYDQIEWLGSAKDFKAWCEGKTGYPIIDAAMRNLNETGQMHNRLRMILASFLCKILLVDWKKGEKYFAEKLLDFDLAANNGGWQWCSSSGCDAQPYFRIFNPYTQSQKFDQDGRYIKQWCPELKQLDSKQIHRPEPKIYAPMKVYEEQRVKALKMYSIVKNPKGK